MADVDVIIPAYKARNTIARALASVAAQTLKPRQTIVVVDGSGDGTLEAAEACRGDMHGVDLAVIWQENQGAGAARNRAIAEATARYVAFLDADDEWLPEKLERSLPYLETGDTVLVSHNVLVNDGTSEKLVDCTPHFEKSGDPFVALYRHGYISTSTAVARRDAVLAVGGFDTSLENAQDFDLWLKMLADPGARVNVFKEALTRYHVTPGSIMSHTRRRLRCGVIIAQRHLPALKERAGSALTSLWFRIVAVHYEALIAYRSRDDYVGAGSVLARLPVSLAMTTLDAAIGPDARPGRATGLIFGAWIVAIFSAYAFQFRHLLGPILQVLGI